MGSFDGVHRGHQHVLAATRDAADGVDVVAVTFDPLPREVLAPDRAPKRLTTLERRIELLRAHGADEVRVLAFSREMAGWSPEEFIQRVLVDELKASVVVVGENFRFGSRAAGDVDLLRSAGSQAGFTVEGLALEGGAEPFSSTLVRTHVAAGHMPEAAAVLGRPHEVSGVVVEGDRRGPLAGVPHRKRPGRRHVRRAARRRVRGTTRHRRRGAGGGDLRGHQPDVRRTRPPGRVVRDRPSGRSVARSISTTSWSGWSSCIACAAWTSFDTVDALVAQMHEDVADTRSVLADLD